MIMAALGGPLWFLETKLNSLLFKYMAPVVDGTKRAVVHMRSFGGESSKPLELRGGLHII